MPSAFIGGTILTMDPAQPPADVLVVDGDRIAAVGDRELLATAGRRRDIDLARRNAGRPASSTPTTTCRSRRCTRVWNRRRTA